MDNPRIGIIGTNWGRMHIGGFRRVGATVCALGGRDQEVTAAIAREEGIALATTRMDELCAAVDIVVVASPDRVHHEHIVMALDAGCHVLSEKPLTCTAPAARALAERAETLAARDGRVTAVSFPYRLIPPVNALANWLANRSPGQWLTVTGRSSFAAAEGRAAVGPMMGASGDFGGASHLIDAGLWLMRSAPVWVEAALTGRPAHSLALHIGLSSGGVIALNHVACFDPGIAVQWHITGDDWEARFDGAYRPQNQGWQFGPAEVFVHRSENSAAVSAESPGSWDLIGSRVAPGTEDGEPWANAHRDTATAFLAAVTNAAPDTKAAQVGKRLADFWQGATVQAVFAAAIQSETEGRRVWLPPLVHC